MEESIRIEINIDFFLSQIFRIFFYFIIQYMIKKKESLTDKVCNFALVNPENHHIVGSRKRKLVNEPHRIPHIQPPPHISPQAHFNQSQHITNPTCVGATYRSSAQVEAAMFKMIAEMHNKIMATKRKSSVKSDTPKQPPLTPLPPIQQIKEEINRFQFKIIKTVEDIQQLEYNLLNMEYKREVVSMIYS